MSVEVSVEVSVEARVDVNATSETDADAAPAAQAQEAHENTVSVNEAVQARGRARLPQLPGIDGLRAIAVIAVLFYHAELAWIPGGFLGVEVFFVISGYLITGLLFAEWESTGHLQLGRFWLRRARRLLPALFVLLAGVTAFAVLFLPDEVATLRSDVLAAAVYVSNWYLVFSNRPYFEIMGRPPLLQHLWSLAVEEQFYLLWPLVFIAGMRLLRSRRAFALAVFGVAVLSALWMAALYQPDVDPSRIYYGTDTRAAGFLIGGTLVLLWPPGQKSHHAGRVTRWLADLSGLCALIGLCGCFVLLIEIDPFLYQGGFAVVALLTAAAIAATVYPTARILPRLLGGRFMRWVGLRSYSIYLWHWPVFMVTRPHLDVPIDGLPLLVLRLVVSAVLADLSYRWIEQPIRQGALERAWRTLREAQGARRWRLGLIWATVVATGAVSVSVVGFAAATALPPAPAADLDLVEEEPASVAEATVPPTGSGTHMKPAAVISATVRQQSTLPATLPVSITAAATARALATATPVPATSAGPTITASAPASTTPAVTATLPLSLPHMTAVGDSVMRGATQELKQMLGDVDVDAVVSRQASAAIRLLKASHDSHLLGEIVIIHIGNNGYFTAKQFDEMMQTLSDVPWVFFVNLRVPRRWEGPNNTVLAEGVKHYPNAELVDWYSASASKPELFTADGVHLQPDGRHQYSELISAQVQLAIKSKD